LVDRTQRTGDAKDITAASEKLEIPRSDRWRENKITSSHAIGTQLKNARGTLSATRRVPQRKEGLRTPACKKYLYGRAGSQISGTVKKRDCAGNACKLNPGIQTNVRQRSWSRQAATTQRNVIASGIRKE
jgi:hypothetical protein